MLVLKIKKIYIFYNDLFSFLLGEIIIDHKQLQGR